jgi:nucleotide-binding universal stress UspA family protein
MGIYRQILVALDRTPLSEPVFQQACALATQNQAKLLLLHCFTLPHSSQVDDGDRYRANLNHFLELAQQQLASSMEDIRQWLSAYAHDAETQGIVVDWDWRLGESGPEICDAARCASVDLIVIGRRGRQGIQEALLGSVSNYVVHRAPCSVLVVQGQS